MKRCSRVVGQRACGVAVLSAFALVGCGEETTSADASKPVSGDASSGSNTKSGDLGQGSCPISAADIRKAVGEDVEVGTRAGAGTGLTAARYCGFGGSSLTKQFGAITIVASGKKMFEMYKSLGSGAFGGTPRAIDLGDEGFVVSTSGSASLYIIDGERFINVTISDARLLQPGDAGQEPSKVLESRAVALGKLAVRS